MLNIEVGRCICSIWCIPTKNWSGFNHWTRRLDIFFLQSISLQSLHLGSKGIIQYLQTKTEWSWENAVVILGFWQSKNIVVEWLVLALIGILISEDAYPKSIIWSIVPHSVFLPAFEEFQNNLKGSWITSRSRDLVKWVSCVIHLSLFTCPILSQNPRQIAINIWLVKTSCKLEMESTSWEFSACILSRTSASPSSSFVSSRILWSLVLRLACSWNNVVECQECLLLSTSKEEQGNYFVHLHC